jgi:hypothetical protein
MGFGLAEGYVELSEKGFSSVSELIDKAASKLTTLVNIPMHGLNDAIEGVASHIKGILSPIGLVSSALNALGAGAGIGDMLGKAMDVSRVKTGFDQLTRSAEATDELLGKLKAQFKGTSISTEEYQAAAKEMLQLGVAAGDVPAKLQVLGNISAATGEPLDAMARALGRMEVTGKVTADTLMMLGPAARGMLSQMYPMLGENLAEAAQNGQIGIEQIEAAIENLGGASGQYAAALAARQNDMLGGWEGLKAAVGSAATEIGGWIFKAFDLGAVAKNLSSFVDWFLHKYGDTIIKVFNDIAAAAKFAWNVAAEIAHAVHAVGEALGLVGENSSAANTTAQQAMKAQERAKRNVWVPKPGPLKTPGLGEPTEKAITQHAKIEHTVRQEVAFVGLSQLAEKMQIEAARQAEREEELALQEQQRQHLEKLAGAVSGNALNVSIQDAGAAARADW